MRFTIMPVVQVYDYFKSCGGNDCTGDEKF